MQQNRISIAFGGWVYRHFAPDIFGSAKIGIFAASLIAGCLGTIILWKRVKRPDASSDAMGVG